MCENYLILIDDLLEGELDAQTADKVSSHIFACRSCEAEFEMLKSEKEIYSQFLFEIEPPANLAERFQAKLEAGNDESHAVVKTSAIFSDWKTKFFGSLSFYPAVAFGVALIVFVSGYFWLQNSAGNEDKTIVSQPPTKNVSPEIIPANKEFAAEQPKVDVPEITRTKTGSPKKVEKVIGQVSIIKTKTVEAKPNDFTAILPTPKKPLIRQNKPQNFVESPKINSEDLAKFKQIRAFEAETAKQMEKVEMLLRAFRNVRYVEGSEEYDVGYEKQQAGKLLAKNILLRQQSEDYGTILTNEMLGKVEPYLLEISNLDTNPSEEEVLEIKQRVKNQNIIVSLQSF